MATLWQHCHVASMVGGSYSIIEDAAIITRAGLIEWIGPRAELAPQADLETVDLGGAWVTPGLIDCHTHAVFGGNRSGEFEQPRLWISIDQPIVVDPANELDVLLRHRPRSISTATPTATPTARRLRGLPASSGRA